MKIHTLEQGTEEWRRVRAGKLTASNAEAISANGAGLKTYIYQTMAEMFSSAIPETYTNEDMGRGKELEEQARAIYELERDVRVVTVGFIEAHAHIGCSPDGLIGDDGLIEIKCHNDAKHFRLLIEGEKGIEKKYWWQMQMQMLVTGRKWCDYVAFNPNFKETLIVHRIEANEQAHAKLLTGLQSGLAMIEEITSKL